MSQEQPPMRVNTAFPKNSLDMLPTAGSSNAQNILKPWVHEMLEKSKAHRERMLQLDCLLKLYKCMENNCSFATAHANKMAEHIRHHPMARFLPCAYCSDWFHSEATIGHVDKEHGLSKFQCRHCFFRAFDAHCVWLHQKFYHPNAQDGDILDILPNECIFQRMKLMNDISSRFATALRSLECTDCKHKMLTLPTFESHINHIEGPIVRCQFCNKSFLKTAIIQHLLRHDIGVFECIYCNHAVTDITYMQLHIINSHSSKPMYYISRLRTCQTSEFSETKSDMLKMMSAKGIVKVVPIRQAHQQHANNSNQFSSDVEIFDTEEGTQKNDKSRNAEPLESVTSDESIKPFSTPASIETSAMTAPCRSRPKKDPMLPIIAKIEGGVQFSSNGDIIGVKESFTTMPPKKYITKTSTKPMEANQQLPITAIPSKVIKHKEQLNVATGTSALQQASDSISTDAPMTNVIRDPQDSHLERAKISSDSKSSWKLNDASNKPSSSCAEIVKICLPKAIALDQGPDTQKPELPAIIVSKTKEKTIQIIADRSVDQCKANVLETHGVPSQRRKRQAGIVVSRNKTNIAIHYLLHDCNLLIEEFLGALKRRLAKTEIDGSFGLKDGLRCYCCLLCYHSSYNMFKLGEHYQIQHHIIDLTVSLVHPDHDSLHSSIVLMLPTRMDFEKKLAKMEELIRLEEEHEVHLQKGARLLDEPKQQEVEASPSQALVGNDTAKVKCYPGARSKANTIPKPCSVGSNKLAKKYPGYQSHIKICGVYNNSLFDCPGARSKANTIPKPCSVGSDELAKNIQATRATLRYAEYTTIHCLIVQIVP
ncbi:hypothetical protein AND_002174 [Anopheles darlingi]|uniref:C2H2-type domain-containing protein n=1 Tax=Anopheles darlingi TaxID=43151 RepID=W5JRV5_ANODA|nr:hypothetical protein AND_002174 [Anopheles darlingi]